MQYVCRFLSRNMRQNCIINRREVLVILTKWTVDSGQWTVDRKMRANNLVRCFENNVYCKTEIKEIGCSKLNIRLLLYEIICQHNGLQRSKLNYLSHLSIHCPRSTVHLISTVLPSSALTSTFGRFTERTPFLNDAVMASASMPSRSKVREKEP